MILKFDSILKKFKIYHTVLFEIKMNKNEQKGINFVKFVKIFKILNKNGKISKI